ncbi:MAG TPA: protein kinase [Polyangiaceae bacterium]|jgi:serine/threonine protein kinase|nr:protein kinase [Polyangiaceae bacterium]
MVDSSARSMMGNVVLGRYRIVAPLARGGMGIIYLGRLEGAAGFAKPVVIKTVIPEGNDSKRSVQLFVREARILSNLEHPSIVGVLDFGEVGTDYVMVLEYVHGFHLGAWSRFMNHARGGMPIAHAVEVMLPVLDALAFAHTLTRPDGTPLGIVHRDISPANILIDHQGHVKLHDFGIARMADDDEFKTQDGTFRGTLSYTAPETLQGVPASPSSDLYGCSVVLYQLISGTNPFKGNTPSETLHRVLTHVPPGLRSLREEVSEKLDRVVSRAIAKDPAQRFESAAELAAALRWARDWSEARANEELVRAIQSDFNGPSMAEYLELEPLAVRDHAWRAVVGPRASLSSIPPPPRQETSRDSQPATAMVRRSSFDLDVQPTVQGLPSDALLELARMGLPEAKLSAPDEATRNARAQRAVAPAPTAEVARVAEPTPERARSKLPLVLVGAVGMLVLGGAAFLAFSNKQEPVEQRFLLIEKQAAPSSSNAAAPPPSAAASGANNSPSAPVVAMSALPQEQAPSAAPSTRSVSPNAGGGSLSGAFQRQQGRVVGCFRSHPNDFSDQPLNVRFKIDGSGAVQSAELSPPGLSNSALGACILGVARSTHFPGTGAPVSFTIPITAVRK